MVTQRRPNDSLYHEVMNLVKKDGNKPPFTMTRIGDCDAPAIVAAATYAGHKFARELEEIIDPDQPLRHERIDVGLAIAANLPSALKF